MKIERQYDAKRLNEILNDPVVRATVADTGEGVIDMKDAAENKLNVLLVGEHGACLFVKLMGGIYEVHTQILQSGRGRWGFKFIDACAEYMYVHTDALEVITRVPKGHLGAHAICHHVGFKYEFERSDNCRYLGQPSDVTIYHNLIQDWMPRAQGMKELGEAIHVRMKQEAERLGITVPPHDTDANHNQYVGIVMKMFFAGNYDKAVTFYNRWAIASRHALISLADRDPLMLKIDIGYLRINSPTVEGIEVLL